MSGCPASSLCRRSSSWCLTPFLSMGRGWRVTGPCGCSMGGCCGNFRISMLFSLVAKGSGGCSAPPGGCSDTPGILSHAQMQGCPSILGVPEHPHVPCVGACVVARWGWSPSSTVLCLGELSQEIPVVPAGSWLSHLQELSNCSSWVDKSCLLCLLCPPRASVSPQCSTSLA